MSHRLSVISLVLSAFLQSFFLPHVFHIRQDSFLVLQSTKCFLLEWSLAFVLKHGWLQRIRNLSSPGLAVLWSEGKSPLSVRAFSVQTASWSLAWTRACVWAHKQRKARAMETHYLHEFPNNLFHNHRFYRDTELTYNACKQINYF